MLSEYIKQNEQYRNEVIEAVDGLTDDKLNKRPDSSSWTIMQVLDHLYLMEQGITKAIESELNNPDSEKAAPKPIEKTLDRSNKKDAPDFAKPPYDYRTLQQMKDRLYISRDQLMRLLDQTNEETLKNKSFPHSSFGPMPLNQWVSFIGLHEKRHLEQIEEIKEQLNK
ncbi:DinB family protein [Domibacillus epiphyticus]|uniref:DinB-like domain-containing protein n=1 Tax=Domibacillus epiphyticus TaxID=1714355 RepID=A0A1V2A8B4_9BACI|nr:DinB family protein [Domibacillus epiphyticus]OMP67170.1 hypothetical protein BTO28_09340 [Domibacillus epiphyticus]